MSWNVTGVHETWPSKQVLEAGWRGALSVAREDYGWTLRASIEGRGFGASVHPFPSAASRQAFGEAVAKLVPETARPEEYDKAVALAAIARWGEPQDQSRARQLLWAWLAPSRKEVAVALTTAGWDIEAGEWKRSTAEELEAALFANLTAGERERAAAALSRAWVRGVGFEQPRHIRTVIEDVGLEESQEILRQEGLLTDLVGGLGAPSGRGGPER